MSEYRARLPFTSVELQKLVMKCGALGIAVLYALEDQLYQVPSVGQEELELVAFQLRLEVGDVRNIVNAMVAIGVAVRDGDTFTLPHVTEDRERMEEKREKWRDRKRTQRSVPGDTGGTPAGVPKLSEYEDEHEDEDELKRKMKEGGAGGNQNPPAVRPAPPNRTPADNPPPEILRAMPPDTPDERTLEALELLEDPGGQPWTRENPFMLAGRRPMRKYPRIRIAPGELAGVLEHLEHSPLPPEWWKSVFKAVEARITTWTAQGKPDAYANAAAWLTGFALTDALEQHNTRLKVERNGRAHA